MSQFTVESGILKRFFEHLVCSLPVHGDRSALIARRKQGTLHIEFSVLLPVPANKVFNGTSAVSVDRHGTADLSTGFLDDGFIEKQIGDGFAVLVDIADGEAEQFADASASTHAQHE